MMFYGLCAAMVATGVVLAVLDRRWIKRPLFGALLVVGLCGGLITTQVSPFNFTDGGYYMQGVIISAGSMLALIGYGVAIVLQFAGRRFAGHERK